MGAAGAAVPAYHGGMGRYSTVPLEEIELSSMDFWLAGRDHREAAFATLRQEAPVQFFEEAEYYSHSVFVYLVHPAWQARSAPT